MTELSGYQILGAGLETILNLEQFRKRMKAVSDAAFETVFQAQNRGELNWRRSGKELADLTAEVAVKNGREEEVIITVFLFYRNRWSSLTHCLTLGGKDNAPDLCSERDARVRRLYEKLMG